MSPTRDDETQDFFTHSILDDFSSSSSPETRRSSLSKSREETPTPSTSRDVTPTSSTSRDIPSTPSTSRKKTIQNFPEQKNKRKRDLEHQALLNRCLGIMSKPSDSFEIFGDFVADELRNMSSKAPDLQSAAKRQIQKVLLDMNDLYDSRTSLPINVPCHTPTSASPQTNLGDETFSEMTPTTFYEHSQTFLNL